ncbi:hypothetical protein HY58_00465 [Flavihumibacter sp. ZG627]|nr:hypothetical protein HY58_00465 [Flavihumibacter sp. ZG627]
MFQQNIKTRQTISAKAIIKGSLKKNGSFSANLNRITLTISYIPCFACKRSGASWAFLRFMFFHIGKGYSESNKKCRQHQDVACGCN